MNPPAHASTLAACLAMLGTAAAAHAQQTVILYVDDDAPAGGNGQSWETAFRDLQDAFDIAGLTLYENSVEIRVGDGTYRPDRGTGLRYASFGIQDDYRYASGMTLSLLGALGGLGATDPDERDSGRFLSVMSGDLAGDDHLGEDHRDDNSYLVLQLHGNGARITIDGMTIEGGADYGDNARIYGGGSGFWYQHPSVTLRDVTYRNNGGGLYASSQVLIDHCRFLDNGPDAWTVVQGENAFITVRDSDFIGNRARLGCVHLGYRATTTIERCRFIANSSAWDGSAVCDVGTSLRVSNSLFAGNAADNGGAIHSSAEHLAITNCTLVDNRARYGGALYYQRPQYWGQGIVDIYNSILWGNSAEIAGAQLASAVPHAAITFEDSLLQGGESGIYGFWFSLTLDNDPSITDPGFADPNGPDNDPATLTDNNYALAADSSCIDRADGGEPGSFDLAGNPRISDGDGDFIPRIDIGCYEFQSPYCPSDVDRDGFVTGLDFDEYTSRFESGDIRADFDADGFVTGLDFDAYVAAFQAGC